MSTFGRGPAIRRRLSDRFREAARRCRSAAALGALVEDAARELGFHYFALLHHASLQPSSKGFVRIDNYPGDWASEFLARGFAAFDPVHAATRRTARAFAWSELGRLTRLAEPQHEILRRSRRFGIGHGFTVPVNVPGEPGGSCSFAVRRGAELPRERLMCAELVGIHAFDAARRLRLLPTRKLPHLSRRQIECLSLLAAGKTDPEIALILGLSVETVAGYVKCARAAYQAVSRTQLAVLALRDDRIRFEDLLIR